MRNVVTAQFESPTRHVDLNLNYCTLNNLESLEINTLCSQWTVVIMFLFYGDTAVPSNYLYLPMILVKLLNKTKQK